MTDTAIDPSLRLADLTKLGEGFAAEVFALPDGRVVKLNRIADAMEATRREAANMAAAARTGIPMPQVFGTVEIEGRPGIVMERLDGMDMLTMLGKKPWKVWSAGKELARLQAQLHAMPADDGLRPVKETLREVLSRSPHLPEDLRPGVLAAVDAAPDGNQIIHGDFHPGQIIETKDGPHVIDWVNASRGHRLADVNRTLMLVGHAELPPGTGKFLTVLARLARRLLLFAYVREYRRLLPFDDRDLRAWDVPAAAERLVDDAPSERDRLVAIVRSGIRANAATARDGQ